MKCQDFETTIIDLARDRMMEAAERETALAHAHSCSECAGLLADQQALTAGLRRLAAASETTEAPATVGSALQAAFREQLRIRTATTASDELKRRRWGRREWVAAAAVATLIATAGFIAWRLARAVPGDEVRHAEVSQPEVPAGSDPARPPESEERNGVEASRAVLPAPAKPDPAPKLRPYRAKSERPGARSNRPPRRVEIATDFIPVSEADLMPMDGGLVVRVELPRSALMAFGLPMNMERAGERIKADVLVGNNGLARAIRFVQ